jgi:predicted acylesterase/phospholipase RssA
MTRGTLDFAARSGKPYAMSIITKLCALPGLYRPVRIGDTDYIDGGVRKTAHISLALEDRCGFVICVNPIVPIRNAVHRRVVPLASGRAGSLSRKGLPAILDQIFRVTLYSRMQYGLERYQREHPESEILVVEPKPEDLPMFLQNIMSTSRRAKLAEYGYRLTMRMIDEDFPRLSRLFARHGLKLRHAVPLRRKPEAPETRAPDDDSPTRLAATLHLLERTLRQSGRERSARHASRGTMVN